LPAPRAAWRAIAPGARPPARGDSLQPVVPQALRGSSDAERSGTHDAANIRTVFYNFGMVGDYPPDPGNVDLSVFHSVEVPKGSGMDYCDGITPFVLAKVKQTDSSDAYIMETGFRERQALSPFYNRVMRFEPRPGWFQADPTINRGRSPALSNDPRTWPDTWPDKVNDPDDPGWHNSWDGYFGKRPAADQESFTVMDDDYYDAFAFHPDARDPSRHGLGLRVEVRGFQWSNPQAQNVIFWHYDITNEGTTDYDDNIIFGLYMDAGVGGSALSCDGIYESDDDNAFFDKSSGLNLVYTWDRYGHGADLISNCDKTGYLGYAYLETPGNAFNGVDDDGDGIIDESRSSGPGQLIVGQDAIRAYVNAHYDMTKFQATYGPLENRPAFKAGRWWTGDEDMDWVAAYDDVGADGVPGTHDTGEGDGIPTDGEPNFDRTDLHESDQIGLTGFKMNRIKAGVGNPNPQVDGIVFYTDSNDWPQRLYDKFSNPYAPARFDSALAANYNIGFLFASGPFQLHAGQHERFSLALAYGADLTELRNTVKVVQQIYNANYQFATPPPLPTVHAEVGDRRVRLTWDDKAEHSVDPVTFENDFEGYRIYRSTDPSFVDPKLVTTARGTGTIGNGVPIAQFDLADGRTGYSKQSVEGVSYWLGDDSGITHTWTDSTVTDGQQYYYAVTAYDYGSDSLDFYPSENAIAVSRTARGGTILPKNVVSVRPEPRVLGWQPAGATAPTGRAGEGIGTADVRVVDSDQVPAGHTFELIFHAPAPDSIRATTYALVDSTTGDTLFQTGADFSGLGIGPVADGLLPVVTTPLTVQVDAARTGFSPTGPTNDSLDVLYEPVLPENQRRVGFPDSLSIVFSNTVVDTAMALGVGFQARPAKFHVIAHTATGDQRLRFRFRDLDFDGTLSRAGEFIDAITYPADSSAPAVTWRFQVDTLGQGRRGPLVAPSLGDTFHLAVLRPYGEGDMLTFRTQGSTVTTATVTREQFQPYVVPNPYVGYASFEPARFAVSGRGDRRIEFRGLPQTCTIRIYDVRGELVQTLHLDGGTAGMVPWDLRTKDNLDVAPGLYIFHVEAPGLPARTGKFAVIK
ncbi:MAG TPA: hypothetical protein VFK69_11690, partial [Candidatus Eisenbacteria bacterium]|nr:hypothetical protein [Candidatus Eisenbacteria bacterium]